MSFLSVFILRVIHAVVSVLIAFEQNRSFKHVLQIVCKPLIVSYTVKFYSYTKTQN